MEARGHAFFEDTLRIGRVMDLFNRARIQKEFEDRVVADAPRQIERRVTELIDWLIDQDFRQWQAITARLAERTRAHRDARPLGAPDVGIVPCATVRGSCDSVGAEAQRVVDTYDKQREAAAIADQARAAVTTAAAAGGAALGLGTLVTLAASTAAADVTGILMASVIATLGFLVIPARRTKAKEEMQSKVSDLRERLGHALRTEFERAQEQSGTASRTPSTPTAASSAQNKHVGSWRVLDCWRWLSRLPPSDTTSRRDTTSPSKSTRSSAAKLTLAYSATTQLYP